MAAADDARPDADEVEGRLGQAAGALSGDRDLGREDKVDRGASSVTQNVDRVADKVKGLLRPGD